jgi:ABC-type glycerol-3-phosphate transport system permease component
VIVGLPFVVLIVGSRLAGFERELEEAAMDLGASYLQTLRFVILPIIFPAMVSALLTAFTVSFDEFAIALFLAGTEPTFPVYRSAAALRQPVAGAHRAGRADDVRHDRPGARRESAAQPLTSRHGTEPSRSISTDAAPTR